VIDRTRLARLHAAEAERFVTEDRHTEVFRETVASLRS
jgi:hypothetical protein